MERINHYILVSAVVAITAVGAIFFVLKPDTSTTHVTREGIPQNESTVTSSETSAEQSTGSMDTDTQRGQAAQANEVAPQSTPMASAADALRIEESPETVDASIYTIPVTVETNVLALMEARAATDTNFSYTGTHYPFLGFFLEEINGKKNSGGFYWFLYVNGESAESGAAEMQVSPGDTVEWRYKSSY